MGKKYRGRVLVKGCLFFSELADEDEGSPEIGMGVLLTKLFHGGLKRVGHVAGLHVAAIERLHEFSGAAIVDVP